MVGRGGFSVFLILAGGNLFALTLGLAGRRDALANNRVVSQLTGSAEADFLRGDHTFKPGIHAHYRELRDAKTAPQSKVLPAFSFAWEHSWVAARLLAADGFVRAQFQLPFSLGLPMQIVGLGEWAVGETLFVPIDLRIQVFRYVGFILGYEALSAHARAGILLGPIEGVTLQSVLRYATRESTLEISLNYAMAFQRVSIEPTILIPEPAKVRQQEKRPSEKIVPAFGVLVKWGLTPVTALQLSRDKNICTLDAKSRALLEKHSWRCRNAP